ncbi:MAG: CRISPR-associated Cse1 family protein [Elusimicrobia bacterium]|nr:MAG: CRISPR-associated Cse1 family protein [Elusimicrobiota bacterium]KAF0157103.1 MAG: CRISPR-associated Cse1 family protein [Elusimicrobiota bacterium]
MSGFNLVDEKWIPVRFPDGTRAELGIRETLLRAKEIAAIEDPSPLVVAALHRFLLAVLYRALQGPTDIEQAKSLFRSGLPEKPIKDYLETWRPRFWLFDEKFPFGQNPHIPDDRLEPWTKLTAEYNATTNKVLFDHTDTKRPGMRESKECARWLLSTMNFSISGGRGYYPSPSPNAMMCIPLGRNLQETLCYNLVPYPNRAVMLGDSALWERELEELPLKNPKRKASGYADLYTWPSRMVFLEEQLSGMFMRFVAGQGFDNTSNISDPMQPYQINEKVGKLPVKFRQDRGTWRDFDSLLPSGDDSAPLTVQNALKLAGGKTNQLTQSVLVLGLRYEPPNANVDFWRMERFVLPPAMVETRFARTEIQQILEDAASADESLSKACSSYAKFILSKNMEKKGTGKQREPDKKDVSEFVKQMPAIPWYWSTLEVHFHEILGGYASNCDPDEIRCRWLNHVRDALKTAWGQHAASVSAGNAWAIRALVKAEIPVWSKIQELNSEIAKYTKQEVHE